VFYVFDVMVLAGKSVMSEPLDRRLTLLEKRVLPKLKEPVRYTGTLDASLSDLIASVKAQGLEGLVAKRRNSRYEGLDEDARQSRTGVRNWRLHPRDAEL
jgi:ATP-dependent DNA ligase